MIQFPGQSITKSLFVLLFISFFLAFAAPTILAGDSDGIKSEDKINTASSSPATEAKADGVAIEKKAPNILFAPLKEINFETPENAVPAKAQTTVGAGEITNVSVSRLMMNAAIPSPTA